MDSPKYIIDDRRVLILTQVRYRLVIRLGKHLAQKALYLGKVRLMVLVEIRLSRGDPIKVRQVKCLRDGGILVYALDRLDQLRGTVLDFLYQQGNQLIHVHILKLIHGRGS